MSSYTDAIASHARALVAPRLRTDWRNTGSYGGDGSLDDLSPQYGGQYTVDQSFNDGLPNDVSLTGSNNASGTLAVPALNGRDEAGRNLRWFANGGSVSSGGNGVTPSATGSFQGGSGQITEASFDLVVVFFKASGVGVVPHLVTIPPAYRLAAQANSNELGCAVLVRDYNTKQFNEGTFDLTFDHPVYYAYLGQSGEQTVDTNSRYLIPNITGVYITSGVNGSTAITTPALPVVAEGIINSFFVVDASATLSVSSPLNATGSTTQTGAHLMAIQVEEQDLTSLPHTIVHPAGTVAGISATVSTTGVNYVAVGVVIEAKRSPKMDARQYFSPYNTQSPIVTFGRDIAPVSLDFGISTATGPQYQRLFTGQMTDVVVKGRQASLDGVSRSRLAMQKAVQIPMINGPRHGGSSTWVLSYACAQCGFFAGPPATYYSRLWAPMHGSIFPFMASPVITQPAIQASGLLYNDLGLTDTSVRPTMIEGPYLTGMNAWQHADTAYQLSWKMRPYRGYWPTQPNRTLTDFTTNASIGYNDVLSQQNWIGRVSMWLKGDASATPVDYTPSVPGLFQYDIVLGNGCYIKCRIDATTREAKMLISDASGHTATWSSGLTFPSDGQWHFVSFTWDYKLSKYRVFLAGVFTDTTLTAMTFADLPASEAAYEATNTAANLLEIDMGCRLPIAEVNMECGAAVYSLLQPIQNAIVPTLITGPCQIELDAPGEPTARAAWSILVDVATANMAAFRCDESDRVVVMPPDLLGQPIYTSVIDDQFTRTVANGWGTADIGGAWSVLGTASQYSTNGARGIMSVAVNNVPTGALLAGSYQDVEVHLYRYVALLGAPTGAPARGGLYAQYVDSNNYVKFTIVYELDGSGTLIISQAIGGVVTVLATRTGVYVGTVGSPTTLELRGRCSGTWIGFKIWAQLEAEPVDWLLVATNAAPVAGQVGVHGQTDTGNTNTKPYAIQFDQFGAAVEIIETIDTGVNAQDLDISIDPTRIRNDVTVLFSETNVSSGLLSVLDVSSTLTIPPGISRAVFALSTPQAGTSTTPLAVNLNSFQIAGTVALPSAAHFVSINAYPDGTGTPLDAGIHGCSATVVQTDSQSVTIEFNNHLTASVYMTNSGDSVPFLRVVGYAVTEADGYSSSTDAASILARGDRTLSTSLPYIQHRDDAASTAAYLVTLLSQPAGVITVTVVGDPTRIPGSLVTLVDSQGTQAGGTWRIMSIKHTGAGAQYTQELALIQVYPIMFWDVSSWDISSWGE